MRLPTVHPPGKVPLKLVGLIATGLLLVGAGFASSGFSTETGPISANAPAPRPASVVEVVYRRQIRAQTLPGTVVPRIESTLGFRVVGKIVARAVDVGASVKPGDVIAELDPADYRLAVDGARAALASAEADHARAKADHERYLNLRGSSAFMAQTLEQRQSLAATTLARVDQARSQLATAENNLAYTVLKADDAGVVTAVLAEVGQVVAQGQGIVRVAGTDALEILVGVPEHRLKAVREASSASFELWSDPGRRHAAKLRELSPSADPTTRTYPARFSIIEPPEFIGLGMTATLTSERPEAIPAAEVPLSAIFQRGTQPAVWVVDKADGTVELRPVTIARWHDDAAAITSGVRDGELIAAAGVHKLEVGQKVKPVRQAAR